MSRLVGNGTNRTEEHGVYCAPYEEEFYTDLLDEMCISFVEGKRGELQGGILFLGAIVMGVLGKGACCGLVGLGWLNCLMALATYPGIERCTCRLAYSQSSLIPMYCAPVQPAVTL